MSSFSSSIFPSLLFSFNLQEIAEDAYYQHKAQNENKAEKQLSNYSVQELFIEEGLNLCALFGYNLSKKLASVSFEKRAQQSKTSQMTFDQFKKIILNVWSDIGDYAILLNALFQLFKQPSQTFINPKTIYQFSQICSQSIVSEIIADFKFKVSPRQLRKIKNKVYEVGEKEDLKGSGMLQKTRIMQIFTEIVGQTISKQLDLSKLPQSLIQGDFIHYEILFNEEFLLSGSKVKEYMDKFRVRRQKEKVEEGKQVKEEDKVIPQKKPTLKQAKKEQVKAELITTLLQKDKKQVNELTKNKLLTAKQLLMEIIFSSVEIAENVFLKDEKKQEQEKYEEAKKCVYTVDPIIDQKLFDGLWQKGTKVELMSESVGFFVCNNQGYSYDIGGSSSTKEEPKMINLGISSLIRQSKIVDWLVNEEKLYLMRADGLLYLWQFNSLEKDKKSYSCQSMIQTSFKHHQSESLLQYYKNLSSLSNTLNPMVNLCSRVLNIDHEVGMIVVDCSNDGISPCLEVYDLEVKYLGRIGLNKSMVGWRYEHFQEARFFLQKVAKKITSDQSIKTVEEYAQVMTKSGYTLDLGPQSLGGYVIREWSSYGLTAQVQHFQLYYSYITSQQSNNPIPLSQTSTTQLADYINGKLVYQSLSAELMTYLKQLNYITSDKESQLREFLQNSNVLAVKNRKSNLITLIEDNYDTFEEILVKGEGQSLIRRDKLARMLKDCDLTEKEAESILSSYRLTPDNLLDITPLTNNEHVLRVRDSKSSRYSPSRRYKSLILPDLCVNSIIPLFKHELILINTTGIHSSKAFILNSKGQLCHCLSIDASLMSVDRLKIKFVRQSNHLLCMRGNQLWIYDVNHFEEQPSNGHNGSHNAQQGHVKPVKVIQGIGMGVINQNPSAATLPSNQLLDIYYSYHQNSFIVLLSQALLVYDFSQLISQKEQVSKFKIKPGYIAQLDNSTKTQSNSYEIKRKYLTNSNEVNIHLLVSPTKYNQNIVTIISTNPMSKYLHSKSFYLVKHIIKTTNQHLSKPLPTKLFKQLQTQAKRNRYQDLPKPLIKRSQEEKVLGSNVTQLFMNKLEQVYMGNDQNGNLADEQNNRYKQEKQQITVKLNSLYSMFNNPKSVISKQNSPNAPQDKLHLLLAIIILPKKQLETTLNPQFTKLYMHPASKIIDRKQMLNDLAQEQEKKFIQRLFYYCSLIDKFLYPVLKDMITNKSSKEQLKSAIKDMIAIHPGQSLEMNFLSQVLSPSSQKPTKIDVQKVVQLISIPHQTPYFSMAKSMRNSTNAKTLNIPSPNLIRPVFQTLNKISFQNQSFQALEIVTQIILSKLPTKFKYLCPRYYNQLIDPIAKPEQLSHNEFFQLNFQASMFDSIPHKQFIQTHVIDNPIKEYVQKDRLRQFLIEKNSYYAYLHQIEKTHPLAKTNYRKMIELLFSFKLINTFQMLHLITRPTPIFVHTSPQDLISNDPSTFSSNIDLIIQTINETIATQSIKLPKPFITLEYFQQKLYPKHNALKIFEQFFSKSDSTQIYTRSFVSIMETVTKKNCSLQYSYSKWQVLAKDQIVPLIPFTAQIQEQFSSLKTVKCQDFRVNLQSYTQTDLTNLTLSCIEASLPNTSRGQSLLPQIKTKPTSFYINVQFFIKYLNQRKKSFFSNLFNQTGKYQQKKNQQIDFDNFQKSINISSYHFIQSLWASGNFLDKNELLNLVSYSTNYIKVQQVNEWISKQVKWVSLEGDIRFDSIDTSGKQGKQMLVPSNISELPQKQFLVDPLQLEFIRRHFSANTDLILQAIAWKMFEAHESLDLAKSFVSKAASYEGNVSFKQASNFIGCESVARWLLKANNRDAIFLDRLMINLNEFTKLLRQVSQILCKKVWEYNLVVMGQEKSALVLSLLNSFVEVSPNKKLRFSSLSKYFICPQSLIQQSNHWTVVLKYLYMKYKSWQYQSQQSSKKKEKNLLTLIESIKNNSQSVEYKHEWDVDEVGLDEFYQCISWNTTKNVFDKANHLRNKVTKSESKSNGLHDSCKNKLQKIIQLSQPQQLTLCSSKNNLQQSNFVRNSKTPDKKALKYRVTPEIINSFYQVQEGAELVLPCQLPFSTFLFFGNENNEDGSLKEYEKSLLKKLYRSILEHSNHEKNTLNEFYLQMRYEQSQPKPIDPQQNLSNIESGMAQKAMMIDKIFPQFYTKVKNFSKALSKLTFHDLTILYALIGPQCKNPGENDDQKKQMQKERYLLSYEKLFRYSTLFISGKVKQKWIVNYIQTAQTIQLLKSQDEISQHKINLAIYEQLIICNMWHESISPSASAQHKQSIAKELISHFDYSKYVFNKWLSKEFPASQQFIQELLKCSDAKQFTSKCKELFDGQMTSLEASTLYSRFTKHGRTLLYYSKMQSSSGIVAKFGSNRLKLLEESIKFFTWANSHIPNINLLVYLNEEFLAKYRLIYTYWVQKGLIEYLENNEINSFYLSSDIFLLNNQKLIQSAQQLITHLILSESSCRTLIKSSIKFLLSKTCLKFETFYSRILNIAEPQLTETDHLTINNWLKLLVTQSNQEVEKLLSDLAISVTQKDRTTLFTKIIECFTLYDKNGIQRMNGLGLKQLKKQILSTDSNRNNALNINSRSDHIEKSYEQVYKDMDIMGVGQLNLNDLQFNGMATLSQLNSSKILSQISTHTKMTDHSVCQIKDPYVKLSSHLSTHFPHLTKKIPSFKPTPKLLQHSEQIINQLLTHEQSPQNIRPEQSKSSLRFKTINKERAMRLMSEYAQEQLLQYLADRFDINKLTNYHYINTIDTSNGTIYTTKTDDHSSGNDISESLSYSYKSKPSSFLNLTNLIKYLLNNNSSDSINSKSNQHAQSKPTLSSVTDSAIKMLIQWVQTQGGVRRITERKNFVLSTAIVSIGLTDRTVKDSYEHMGQVITALLTQLFKSILQSSQRIPQQQVPTLVQQQSPLKKTNSEYQTILRQLDKIIKEMNAYFTYYNFFQKQLLSKTVISELPALVHEYLITTVEQLLDYHYLYTLELKTPSSNPQIQRLRLLSIKNHKLLQKLYTSCSLNPSNGQVRSKYEIFHMLISSNQDQDSIEQKTSSNKSKFDLLDLWLFINSYSSVAYSRDEVNQIFKIIDENDDKDISFKEFITFWIATQQLLPQSLVTQSGLTAQSRSLAISQMKLSLRKSFLEIFQTKIESTNPKNPLLYSEVLKMLNTSNKQKVNKLLEIVLEDKQNNDSPGNIIESTSIKKYTKNVTINNLSQISIDKDILRTIVRLINQTQSSKYHALNQNSTATPQQNCKNLILEYISEDLHEFILAKTRKTKTSDEEKQLRKQDLIKYVVFKYPLINYSILQSLHQLTGFFKQELLKVFKPLMQASNSWKQFQSTGSQQDFSNKKNLRKIIYESFQRGDSLNKTYHFLTKLKVTNWFGDALATRILFDEIIDQTATIKSQVQQLKEWVSKQAWRCLEELPLIYGAKQKPQIMPSISSVKPINELQSSMLNVYSQKISSILTKDFPQSKKYIVHQSNSSLEGKITIIIGLYKQEEKTFSYVQETITLKEDTRFKSNNLATLALNSIMYCDEEVSLSPILNQDELKKSKGQSFTLYIANVPQTQMHQVIKLNRPHKPQFSCITSLIKLAELNFIIHKKYRTIGVLFDIQNLWHRPETDHEQPSFRLKHFYQGVNLGPDGNYAEGFDLTKFYSNINYPACPVLSLPPQLHENIYTYAADSYNIGQLIYMFYTGESFQKLKSQQIELQRKRLSLQGAQKHLIEQAPYFSHSFIHSACKQKLRQISKQLGHRHQSQKTKKDLQIQQFIYTLIYKCTLYNWYERPQMCQIIQSLNKIRHFVSMIDEQNQVDPKNFLQTFNQQQLVLTALAQKNLEKISDLINLKNFVVSQYVWTIQGLFDLKNHIDAMNSEKCCKKQLQIQMYEFFNTQIKFYVKSLSKSLNFDELSLIKHKKTNSLLVPSSQSKIHGNDQFHRKGFQADYLSLNNKSSVQFGQTHQSMFFNTKSKVSPTKKNDISPTKTFLQSQSMLYTQKMNQNKFNVVQNQQSQRKIMEINELTEQLLQLVISYISSAQTKPTLWISLFLFKDILNEPLIKRYLDECDIKWSVEDYDVLSKIQQVNLKNKLQRLPKNSYFYNDFYQLMEEKITLNLIHSGSQSNELQEKSLQHQSSKQLALNHILSILLSNNLNKLNALYQSKIIEKLYIYLGSKDEELKAKVVQIYRLVSGSLKSLKSDYQTKRKIQCHAKKIDEVFKTMMVVYDELKLTIERNAFKSRINDQTQTKIQSPSKKSKVFRIKQSPSKVDRKPLKSSPVIDLLTYVQNLYIISGYQCTRLIQTICQEQMCHLFSLINICEEIYEQRKSSDYVQILSNLCLSKSIYDKLKNDLVGILTFSKLKVLQKNGILWNQISQSISLWQNSTKLIEISSQLFEVKETYEKRNSKSLLTQMFNCINNNIVYFKSLKANQTLSNELGSGARISQYNCFYTHFEELINFLQKILLKITDQNDSDRQECLLDQNQRLILLECILSYLQLTVEEWQTKQTMISRLIELLNSFYNKEVVNAFTSNQVEQKCIQRLLRITEYLAISQPVQLISLSFIHIYHNILRKQFQRMELFFGKKVQKSRVVPIYFFETEWRLTVLESLLHGQNLTQESKKQAIKQLATLDLGKYIFQSLYVNQTLMDLRYFQSFEEGVPYRFCRPFKSEALAMIGILLRDNQSQFNIKAGVQGDIASRLTSLIKPLTDNLKDLLDKLQSSAQPQKKGIEQAQILEIVEIIWLLSQVSQSNDERLKYQFINSGTHKIVEKIFESSRKIRKLFPRLHRTVSSNSMIMGSKVFQKSQLYESRRQFKKGSTFVSNQE